MDLITCSSKSRNIDIVTISTGYGRHMAIPVGPRVQSKLKQHLQSTVAELYQFWFHTSRFPLMAQGRTLNNGWGGLMWKVKIWAFWTGQNHENFLKFVRMKSGQCPNSKFYPDYASGLTNPKNCPDQLIRPQKMLQESGWRSKSLLHWKTVLSSDEQASEVLLKIELWISNNNEHKLVQYLSISVLQTQS